MTLDVWVRSTVFLGNGARQATERLHSEGRRGPGALQIQKQAPQPAAKTGMESPCIPKEESCVDMFRTILAATDFSDDATNAVYRAAFLAAEQQGRLELLHVLSETSLKAVRELIPSHGDAETKLIDDAQRMLDALGSRVAEDTRMAAVSRIAIGAVLDEILSAAEQADLLVLGAHGSNRWREMFLGTTADRLLRMCTRPVLVIKRPPETSYRRALVPVDFSPHSIAALNTAMRVAPNADIMVVHASAVPFEGMLRQGGVLDDEIERFRGQAQQEAMSRISSLIDEVAEGSRRLFRFVELEDAARLILAKEESFGADLIVMGKHGKNVVEEMLLGSVTRRILSDSKCDVLIVHEGSTATGSPAA